MKNFLIFLLVFLVGFQISIRIASAHVLVSQGSIGAVLHIDPQDDPIAGSQSGFFFEFKDKQNKFKPENCNCTFEIWENGQQINSQDLFESNTNPSLTSASIFFTFPQKDVYQIKVVGNPKTVSAFQPFTLTYNIRVAKEVAQNQLTNNPNQTNFFNKYAPLLLSAFVAAFIIIVYLIQQMVFKKRKEVQND